MYADNDPIRLIDVNGESAGVPPGTGIVARYIQDNYIKPALGNSWAGRFYGGFGDAAIGTIEGMDIMSISKNANTRAMNTVAGFVNGDTEQVLESAPITGEVIGVGEMIAGAARGEPEALGQMTFYAGMAVAGGVNGKGSGKPNTKIHKNSNNYVGKQAVYEITMDGVVQKYGKADATNISKTTGQPRRLQSQVNKMQKNNPSSVVKGKVIYQKSRISTKNIKKVETKYIQRFKNKNGDVPRLNQGHPGIY